MSSDQIFVWQEWGPDEQWGAIAAIGVIPGLVAQLSHRNRDVAVELMGPLARQHHEQSGRPVRLACYGLPLVIAELGEQPADG